MFCSFCCGFCYSVVCDARSVECIRRPYVCVHSVCLQVIACATLVSTVPYWVDHSLPRSAALWAPRLTAVLPFDVVRCLSVACSLGSLVLTLPWLCGFLKCTLHLPQYRYARNRALSSVGVLVLRSFCLSVCLSVCRNGYLVLPRRCVKPTTVRNIPDAPASMHVDNAYFIQRGGGPRPVCSGRVVMACRTPLFRQ